MSDAVLIPQPNSERIRSRPNEPILEALPGEPPLDAIVVLESPPVVLLEEEVPPVLLELDVPPVRQPGIIRRTLTWIGWVYEWCFGVVALIFGLAVLAVIPVVQFLVLGYLLEVGGRIGRTGRFRDGFVGVRKAARVGNIVLATWLILWPLRLVSSLAFDGQLIDPNGPVAWRWKIGLFVLTALAVLHIALACARGGQLRYFFLRLLPFNAWWLLRRLLRGGYYAEARDGVWNFAVSLRLPYYFWLGFRGFVGAFAWLALPVSLLVLGSSIPRVGFLIGFPAAFLLAFVLMHLPFLQMRFAAQNRLGAMFEFFAIRACYQRAPWAFTFAFFITLLFAVPLYLLKIEMIPREAAWVPSLVFIVFIFPARLLAGWAYARSQKRDTPRHWFFRWTGRLWMLPVALLYVLIVYFTQFTTWAGVWGMYEQHAFLLPVPFVSM